MSEQAETAAKARQKSNDVSDSEEGREFEALAAVLPEVIASFKKVNAESRKRLLSTLATFFGIEPDHAVITPSSRVLEALSRRTVRSRRRNSCDKSGPAPHGRGTSGVPCVLSDALSRHPHFKTLDISQLNTEAAQIKFANAANSVNNASTYGYLTATTKGNKQLTAAGEAFVEALPDRDAAREAMSNARPRRRRKSGDPKKNGEQGAAPEVVAARDNGKTP